MLTELAKRYQDFSGLNFIDIDKEIEECPFEKLTILYRKLIWLLQKGIRLNTKSEKGKEFAWIVCNLAIRCGIEIHSQDIIKDGILDFNDFITRYELEFAHKIIDHCDHLDEVLFYLLAEEEDFLVLEEGDDKIILDR